LAFPAAASAHAWLVGSKPADGAVLATPPGDVRLLFDDDVRPAGGAAAVDAKGRSVLAGPERRLAGNPRAIVVPLRSGLARGAYTVRRRRRLPEADPHAVGRRRGRRLLGRPPARLPRRRPARRRRRARRPRAAR